MLPIKNVIAQGLSSKSTFNWKTQIYQIKSLLLTEKLSNNSDHISLNKITLYFVDFRCLLEKMFLKKNAQLEKYITVLPKRNVTSTVL